MKIAYDIDILSINKAFQGRRFKTPEYKGYEQELLLKLPKLKQIKGNVQINYLFKIKNFDMRDLDNCIKLITDILVKRGYIEDDRKIITFTATKVKSEVEGFEIEILPL